MKFERYGTIHDRNIFTKTFLTAAYFSNSIFLQIWDSYISLKFERWGIVNDRYRNIQICCDSIYEYSTVKKLRDMRLYFKCIIFINSLLWVVFISNWIRIFRDGCLYYFIKSQLYSIACGTCLWMAYYTDMNDIWWIW